MPAPASAWTWGARSSRSERSLLDEDAGLDATSAAPPTATEAMPSQVAGQATTASRAKAHATHATTADRRIAMPVIGGLLPGPPLRPGR